MTLLENHEPKISTLNKNTPKDFFLDLVIYITVMFLIREVYFSEVGFLTNGLFWSFTTLIVASWRMKVRGVTWKGLGLSKPKNIQTTLIATAVILVSVPITLIFFGMIKGHLPFLVSPDVSEVSAVSKFGNLKGNWAAFFSIIFFVWIQSSLEEMLDRGFLMVWIERLFSSTMLATILAVIIQAMIFGFRHSNDFSERSITTGLIGLIMGIAYMVFGRNLWALILAHCALNTISMVGRVL